MKVIGQVPLAVPSTLVTTKFESIVQLSVMVKPADSNADTVVIAVGASETEQPLAVNAVKVPVTTGAVVSLIFIVWIAVVAFPQTSVIVYVLVKVIGQVPLAVPSTLVTTKFESIVQLSVMVKPADSNADTVVIAVGASETEQPLAVNAVKVPVTTGAVVSLIFIVWVAVVAFPQTSVIVYVLVKVIGQVPLAVPSTLVTTKFESIVQLSVMVKPADSNADTVVIAVGASETEQPLAVNAVKVPVTTGAVVSLIFIVWVAVVAFPQTSVIVYVLVKVIDRYRLLCHQH